MVQSKQHDAERPDPTSSSRHLGAITRATELLTLPRAGDPQVLAAMTALAEVMAVDRVCIQVLEPILPDDDLPWLQACVGRNVEVAPLPLDHAWRAQLTRGEVVLCTTAGADGDACRALAERGIASMAAAPITIEGRLRGCLRFDQLDCGTPWSQEALMVIRTAGVIFSAALRHREAQTDLEQSEAKFQRLVEHAPDVVYRMSLPDGRYEYVSPAATEVLGYAPDEFYKRTSFIEAILHPGWIAYFKDQWSRLKAGEMPPTYTYVVIHGQTGEPRWCTQRNVLIRNGRGAPVAIEGIISDITAQKVAEARLHQSEATLNGIMRAAPIGIALNTDRTMLLVNDRLCEMTGYEREELVGQLTRRFYATREEWERVGHELVDQLNVDSTASIDTRWVRKDGTVFDVWVTATCLTPRDYPGGVVFTALETATLR